MRAARAARHRGHRRHRDHRRRGRPRHPRARLLHRPAARGACVVSLQRSARRASRASRRSARGSRSSACRSTSSRCSSRRAARAAARSAGRRSRARWSTAGHVADTREAFDRWLGRGCPASCRVRAPSPEAVIDDHSPRRRPGVAGASRSRVHRRRESGASRRRSRRARGLSPGSRRGAGQEYVAAGATPRPADDRRLRFPRRSRAMGASPARSPCRRGMGASAGPAAFTSA